MRTWATSWSKPWSPRDLRRRPWSSSMASTATWPRPWAGWSLVKQTVTCNGWTSGRLARPKPFPWGTCHRTSFHLSSAMQEELFSGYGPRFELSWNDLKCLNTPWFEIIIKCHSGSNGFTPSFTCTIMHLYTTYIYIYGYGVVSEPHGAIYIYIHTWGH